MEDKHDDRLEQNAVFRATIDFIDKRITTSEIRNKDEHDAIIKKVEIHNGFAGKLENLTLYCNDLKNAKIRERITKLEVYLVIGVALATCGFGVLGLVLKHYITLILSKLAGL